MKTVNSIKSKNGNTPLATSPSLAFATDCITYKFRPTGGVIKAHSTITTMKMPNQIGSIPMLIAAGSKTGTMIRTMDKVSNTSPIAIKTMQTTMIKSVLLST